MESVGATDICKLYSSANRAVGRGEKVVYVSVVTNKIVVAIRLADVLDKRIYCATWRFSIARSVSLDLS